MDITLLYFWFILSCIDTFGVLSHLTCLVQFKRTVLRLPILFGWYESRQHQIN